MIIGSNKFAIFSEKYFLGDKEKIIFLLGLLSPSTGYGDHMSYRLLDIRIVYMAIGNWLHGYMVIGYGN
jgi:hypothetical protein